MSVLGFQAERSDLCFSILSVIHLTKTGKFGYPNSDNYDFAP